MAIELIIYAALQRPALAFGRGAVDDAPVKITAEALLLLHFPLGRLLGISFCFLDVMMIRSPELSNYIADWIVKENPASKGLKSKKIKKSGPAQIKPVNQACQKSF